MLLVMPTTGMDIITAPALNDRYLGQMTDPAGRVGFPHPAMTKTSR